MTHHIKHYLPLFGILATAFVGFIIFRYDRDFQAAIILAASTGYVVWGIMHHFIHKDLTTQIVLEYVAVAVLGVTLVFSVIMRA